MSRLATITLAEWEGRLGDAGLGGGVQAQLATYLAMLGKFAGALDLVGNVGAAEVVTDHVLESLAALPHLPVAGPLLDVGSGAGFPAIPVLVARPTLQGTLLEPRERRWAFLREVVRELGLEVEVRRERMETFSAVGFAALTVRALSPSIWALNAYRLLKDGGVLIWWCGSGSRAPVRPEGMTRVLTSPLPEAGRGKVVVWRRRST